MLYLTIIGAAFITWLIVAMLFTPHIPYHIEADVDARSDHFVHVLESTCQTHLEHGNRIEILTNGDQFYPAMLQAIRGARETINMECYIVPGRHTDQRWVRLASRRMYGQMLEAGVRIFEYERGMTHVKTLLVDDLWAVIGTTNLDNRSFEHNDEVNLVVRDESVTARLTRDFQCDLSRSCEIHLDEWRRRPLWEKLIGTVAWILERQQ